MTSFIGILLGLVFFVVIAFCGYNLILSAIGGVCIMFLFSGIPIMTGLTGLFLPSIARFVESYFLLFLFSALLGKLMSDGGTAKKISLALTGVIKKAKTKKDQHFFSLLLVPVLYFILCYIGISGFVVIFTVLPIAKDLFIKTDTPWRLYCVAGAQSVSQAILIGSLAVCNIYAAEVCGTKTTSGIGLSIVMVVTFWVVSLVMLRITAADISKNGEGFLPSGAGIQAASINEGIPEDQLPGLIPSLIPMVSVVVLSAVFGINVIVVLFIGCLMTIVVGWKNIKPHIKDSISAGVVSSYGSILSVSVTSAIGATLTNLEGFSVIENALSQMPPMLEGTALGLLASFIMAGAAAPVAAFGPRMLEKYMEAGLTAAHAHRMMALTSFSSLAPHNAGISNAAQVLHIPYSDCLKGYMIYSYIPGFITLIVAFIVLTLGIV